MSIKNAHFKIFSVVHEGKVYASVDDLVQSLTEFESTLGHQELCTKLFLQRLVPGFKALAQSAHKPEVLICSSKDGVEDLLVDRGNDEQH